MIVAGTGAIALARRRRPLGARRRLGNPARRRRRRLLDRPPRPGAALRARDGRGGSRRAAAPRGGALRRASARGHDAATRRTTRRDSGRDGSPRSRARRRGRRRAARGRARRPRAAGREARAASSPAPATGRTDSTVADRTPRERVRRSVSWSGGLFAAGEFLLDAVRRRARPRGAARRSATALDGAARLLERPPLFKRPDPRSRSPMTRLGHLSTEGARAERAEIDRLPTAELVRLMNDDDRVVPAGRRRGADAIAAAVDAIADAAGGRRAADLRRRGDGGAARRARRQRVRADVQHRPRARRDRGRARSR